IAGKGKASQSIPVINEFFSKHGLSYEIHLTKYPGHAIDLARSFAENESRTIVAAGGDGTCNEVINGLMQAKPNIRHVPLFGVLPIGRGNDFAYGAHIPSDLKKSLLTLLRMQIQPMDVGLVVGGDYPQGRFFGNGIGVGFDTIVGLEAARMKNLHGAAAYFWGALKTIILYPPAPTIDLTFDDSCKQVKPAIISIMNGNRMGGIFFMSPEANNNDGILNLCTTQQGTRRALLKTMVHYIKGSQSILDNTTTLQSPAFTLKATEGVLVVHADGETICEAGTELEITCLPAALKIICHPEI
ncbi:MAG TPA: YegS/Rv2252/BmrU family lipid kinase, partial [Candidatus Cloacimonadota bacterium]|nr:YegS/Rv2252/BmrU family lipid kinase [Candidatus Cloacimonadota bacterium]